MLHSGTDTKAGTTPFLDLRGNLNNLVEEFFIFPLYNSTMDCCSMIASA